MTAGVELRPARAEDARLLFDWRNDPDTRTASRNRAEVSWDEHTSWLARVLADPAVVLLVAEAEGDPIGQVRFDGMGGDEVEISVSIDPATRGRGVGTSLIVTALSWLRGRDHGGMVVAEVRPDNAPSLAAFARAGFEPAGERGEMLRFQRPVGSAATD